MAKHCANCGDKLVDAMDICPKCGSQEFEEETQG
jgi:RNA polymerase subunit RPABC4/transcription elongation factor Spt4